MQHKAPAKDHYQSEWASVGDFSLARLLCHCETGAQTFECRREDLCTTSCFHRPQELSGIVRETQGAQQDSKPGECDGRSDHDK